MIGEEFMAPSNFRDPIHLFKVVVNNIIYKGKVEGFYAHGQMANIVFGSGDDINQSYLSIVTNNFGSYLLRQNKGQKYSFDFDKIEKDFPKWFNPNLHFNTIDEIRLALKKEKEAAIHQRTGRIIDIIDICFLSEYPPHFLYQVHLDMESDPAFVMAEGLRIRLAFDKKRYWAEVLFFDDLEFKLIIRTKKKIKQKVFNDTYRRRIAISPSWLIDRLSACFEDYPNDNKLINRLLSKDWRPEKVKCSFSELFRGKMDEPQLKALKSILSRDITALWGPPGTGKTTTLSYLLLDLFKKREKTLVCSIANVAVDALLVKLVHTLEEHEEDQGPLAFRDPGMILRLGYINNREIRGKSYLKQQDSTTNRLNYLLDQINMLLKGDGLSDKERAIKESDKLDLKNKLEERKAKLLLGAQLIFTTASKFTVDKSLQGIEFDNLVIDEASMMSVPYLLALAKRVRKRIIIAGDFMQLGPIAVSSSYFSFQWLRKDLFYFYGINKNAEHIEHPALSMITNQRRFHDSICELINTNFYRSQLNTETDDSSLKLLGRAPHEDSVIIYHDLSEEKDFQTKRTREQSRFNSFSAQHITNKILMPIYENPPLNLPFSIAIVTPYRAQVAYIDKLVKQKFDDKAFRERIRIGTVHSFQGSESDLLIFDLVDARNMKVGRLFWQEEGERLVNVAISRATGKLIIVGDIKALTEGNSSNNLSFRTRSVLNLVKNK